MEVEKLKKSLMDSIFDVLENMFFMPVEASSQELTLREWLKNQGTIVGASLNFSGALNGRFYFLIPEREATSACASFLGIEEGQVSEEQLRDTIKEMLNMIGGRTLSREDPGGNFRLGIPEYISASEINELIEKDEMEHIPLETDRGHLAICYYTEI